MLEASAFPLLLTPHVRGSLQPTVAALEISTSLQRQQRRHLPMAVMVESAARPQRRRQLQRGRPDAKHAGSSASTNCIWCGNAPAGKDAGEIAADARSKETLSTETLQLSTLPPLHSAFRNSCSSRGTGPRREKSPCRNSVTFTGQDVTTAIDNFRYLSDNLWYQHCPVECDLCCQPMNWDHQGDISGAPGRSRFSQWRALCGTCQVNGLYTEMGAWLVVGLAASGHRDGNDQPCRNIKRLLDQMRWLCPELGGGDQMEALLGEVVRSLAESA
jgi:hypothetical protein